MPMPLTTRQWGERNAPCKGCVDRVVGCHGKCERYAAFKEQNEKERQARNDYLKTTDMLIEIHKRRCRQ